MAEITVVESPTILTPEAKPAEKTAEELLFKETPGDVKKVEPAKAEPAKADVAKTEETKPGETKTTEDPAKKVETAKADPAKPEIKDIALAVPEGSLLTKEEVAALAKQAKEQGLTQEQAEAELKVRDASVKSYESRRVEAEKQTLVKISEEWKASCAKDPVIGGQHYEENVKLAERGFKAIADLELQQLAAQTGFGNHPAVVRAFLKVGRMMADDTLVRGNVSAPTTQKSAEERLYGATTPAN